MRMAFVAAKPTAGHAQAFYDLAQMAADDLFTQLFGGRAQVVLKSMFGRADNELSHEQSRFLIAEDEIAGLLHSYPARWAAAHSQRGLWLYLRYAGLQSLRFLLIGFLLRDIFDFLGENLADDDFYIAFLAVYPQFRGRGYSKALLAQAHEQAAAASCSRLVLDVDEHNSVARAAYARAGFQEIDASKLARIDGERIRILRLAKAVEPRG